MQLPMITKNHELGFRRQGLKQSIPEHQVEHRCLINHNYVVRQRVTGVESTSTRIWIPTKQTMPGARRSCSRHQFACYAFNFVTQTSDGAHKRLTQPDRSPRARCGWTRTGCPTRSFACTLPIVRSFALGP